MRTLIYIVGVILVIMGAWIVLYTSSSRGSLQSITKALPPRVLAVLPVIIGGLLIVSGPWSRDFWVVEILGAIALLKGVVLIALPSEKADRLVARWRDGSSETLWRLMGLISVVLGAYLFFRA